MSRPLTFYEFFAGGGMARLGLGPGWRCAFANDFDPVKAATYRANFPDAAGHFHEGDVWKLTVAELPGRADLAWASSPCQDFSLAGARAGLAGERSSALMGFWRLIEALGREDRAPRTVVIENVVGLLSSHAGRDFHALCRALAAQGYRFGAVEAEAADFLPQSRPRLFVVATLEPPPSALEGDPSGVLVERAHRALPDDLKTPWVWWRWPRSAGRNTTLASLLEPDDRVAWLDEARAARLLAQLPETHARRLSLAVQGSERFAAAAYRRIRSVEGRKAQRLEARFDGLAGCLRTPKGGSSRQFLLVAADGVVKARLMTAREGARLMGLADDYRLPRSETAGWRVVGDGVAVPVVRHLAAHLLEPLLAPTSRLRERRLPAA